MLNILLALALIAASVGYAGQHPSTRLSARTGRNESQEPGRQPARLCDLFVIGADGVLVVDTNFGPSSSRQVLAELLRISLAIYGICGRRSVVRGGVERDARKGALQPKIIVPGHGPVMRDPSYLRQMSALFESVTKQVKAAADAGQSLEQARKSVDVDEFRQTFAGDSQLKRFLFANYVAGPAVTSAFRAARQ